MIDIGVNLGHEAFDAIALQLLRDCEQQGITCIATGTGRSSRDKILALRKEFDVAFTVGLHPHRADSWRTELPFILSDASQTRCVAVGETGLDYWRQLSSRQNQRDAFEEHIRLAIQLGKPLFLHVRNSQDRNDAFSDALAMLKNAGCPPGVVHCFTGNDQQAQSWLAHGYHVGVTGWITKPTEDCVRTAVSHVPWSRLHIETDAPYLRPQGSPRLGVMWQGRPCCLPHHLPWVFKALASAKGLETDDASAVQEALATLRQNAKDLFQI